MVPLATKVWYTIWSPLRWNEISCQKCHVISSAMRRSSIALRQIELKELSIAIHKPKVLATAGRSDSLDDKLPANMYLLKVIDRDYQAQRLQSYLGAPSIVNKDKDYLIGRTKMFLFILGPHKWSSLYVVSRNKMTMLPWFWNPFTTNCNSLQQWICLCDFNNILASGHNQLWRYPSWNVSLQSQLYIDNIFQVCYIQVLWLTAAINLGSLRLRIASLWHQNY